MRILSASADPDEWDTVIARLPEHLRDVHFTSAYGRVQEAANIGQAVLAVQDFELAFVAQPFLMRRIAGTEFFDLTNLYGFGGPVSNVQLVHSLKAYGDAFRYWLKEWALDRGIVSEYCVLHPLMSSHMLPLLVTDNVLFAKQVVVIEDLKNFTEDRCARRVKRALKRAAQFDVVEHLDPFAFSVMYDASMLRLRAAERWRYDINYWLAHKRQDVGAGWYFIPGHRALLVIGCKPTAYAHFLGSDGKCVRDGLDEFLYFSVARDLARQGFERFHLGGGLTEREDDSLLAFKSGFSETRYSVGTYRRIFMPDAYEQLTLDRAPDANWFPAYRGGENGNAGGRGSVAV